MDVPEALSWRYAVRQFSGLTTSVICAIGRRDPGDASAGLQKVRFEHRDMVAVV